VKFRLSRFWTFKWPYLKYLKNDSISLEHKSEKWKKSINIRFTEIKGAFSHKFGHDYFGTRKNNDHFGKIQYFLPQMCKFQLVPCRYNEILFLEVFLDLCSRLYYCNTLSHKSQILESEILVLVLCWRVTNMVKQTTNGTITKEWMLFLGQFFCPTLDDVSPWIINDGQDLGGYSVRVSLVTPSVWAWLLCPCEPGYSVRVSLVTLSVWAWLLCPCEPIMVISISPHSWSFNNVFIAVWMNFGTRLKFPTYLSELMSRVLPSHGTM
jgi:hypothetical protein